MDLRYGICLLALWLFVGRFQKRSHGLYLPLCLGRSCPPSLALMPDPSVPPCMPLATFKLLPWCWSEWVWTQMEWVWLSPCEDPLRGTAWDSRSFFYQLSPCWVLYPQVMGIYLPGTGSQGRGPCGGWDSSLLRYASQIFIHYTWMWDQLFCISAPTTSLEACGFFNSLIVRLPFNSISDGSEWWFFYGFSMVKILMWLSKEFLPMPISWLEDSSKAHILIRLFAISLKLLNNLEWSRKVHNIIKNKDTN